MTMYYATYDITENVTRESIIQILKDAGLVRIQKSVFCGELSNQQKKDLTENIRKIVEQERDSFYLITSCNQCFGKMITIGKDFDEQYVQGKKPSMVF